MMTSQLDLLSEIRRGNSVKALTQYFNAKPNPKPRCFDAAKFPMPIRRESSVKELATFYDSLNPIASPVASPIRRQSSKSNPIQTLETDDGKCKQSELASHDRHENAQKTDAQLKLETILREAIRDCMRDEHNDEGLRKDIVTSDAVMDGVNQKIECVEVGNCAEATKRELELDGVAIGEAEDVDRDENLKANFDETSSYTVSENAMMNGDRMKLSNNLMSDQVQKDDKNGACMAQSSPLIMDHEGDVMSNVVVELVEVEAIDEEILESDQGNRLTMTTTSMSFTSEAVRKDTEKVLEEEVCDETATNMINASEATGTNVLNPMVDRVNAVLQDRQHLSKTVRRKSAVPMRATAVRRKRGFWASLKRKLVCTRSHESMTSIDIEQQLS